jgi:bis(5'-nucleosyl)-tetraphosphatase (symmetrical)
MATYAIGDLQGCYPELRALLDRLRFDPARDDLWFVGDLVNRGPTSLECLRFVKRLGARAKVVLGNHDLHLLAIALGAGRKPRRGDTLQEVLDAPDRDELLDWLRRRPLLHHDPLLGYTMVHAGLPPQWDLATATLCAREVEGVLAGPDHAAFLGEMYGDQPDLWSEGLTGTARLRFAVNALTRMRFCTHDGRLELHAKGAPRAAPPELVPWFAVRGRRSTSLNLIFGHWSTLGEADGFGVFPLDTGCVWGGRLSALRLDGEGGWTRVPCRGALVPAGD